MKRELSQLLEQHFHGLANLTIEERDGVEAVVREKEPTRRFITSAIDAERASVASETIDLSFSSEFPVIVWGEPEILSHHTDDVDLSPIREVGAILKNHDPKMIVGAPEQVWIDEASRKGRATVRWGTTETAKTAKHEAVVDKTLRGVSVGYRVSEWVYLKDATQKYREISGPAWVAAKWSVLEASLTPIPADPAVGVKRNQQENSNMKTPEQIEAERLEKIEREAKEAKTKADREAKEKADREKADTERAKAEAEATEKREREAKQSAETERCAAIAEICAKHGVDPLPHIRTGKPLSEVYKAILDERETKGEGSGLSVKRDGRDSFRQAAIEGLSIRAGTLSLGQTKHGGETLAGYSLLEMARECLRRAGMDVHGDKLSIAARALAGPRMDAAQLRAFATSGDITVGTSDFPLLLAALAGKTLDQEYADAPTHYKQWCAIGSVPDFKDVTRVEISEIGELALIPELAPYTQAKFAERQEKNRVYTYGKKYGISRQAVINDDLDGFLRIPRAFARSAARMPQILALKKLLANPVLLKDSVATFASGHGNLLTSGDYALDTLAHAEAGIRKAKALMGKQRQFVHGDNEAEAAYLNLMPKFMLVNSEDEFIALQALKSAGALSNANAGVVNPLAGWGIQVISDENITNAAWSGTATQWFMFASPKDAPVIEVVFLNGQQTPYQEEADQADVDGRYWKIRLDVNAEAIGYRGGVRVDGA
jgi:hypothetical protein